MEGTRPTYESQTLIESVCSGSEEASVLCGVFSKKSDRDMTF